MLKAFGNSLTTGFGTSPGWVSMLGTQLGVTCENGGLNGAMFPDIAESVYAVTPASADAYVLALGTNELKFLTEPAPSSPRFTRGLLAQAVWLSAPEKSLGVASSEYSGTWNATPAYGIGKYSHTQGDRATLHTLGDVAYIGCIAQDVAYGTFDVTIDGKPKGSYSCAAPGLSTYLHTTDPSWWQGTIAPFCLRFPNLGQGWHDIDIKVTSATDPYAKVHLDWWAGNEQLSPRVVLATPPRLNPFQGYEAQALAYRNICSSVGNMLRRDGLNVRLADWYSVVSSWQPDGTHPDQAAQTPMMVACRDALLAA